MSIHGGQYAKNIGLIAISLFFSPLDSLIVLIFFFNNKLRALQHRECSKEDGSSHPGKKILVTGIGMSKGLVLARAFHKAGHVVIGADFDAAACGRVSKSISSFHTLKKPDASRGSQAYVQGLLDIIIQNRVDLWVSCSGVASAVEDGEAKEIIEGQTRCKAIQFDIAATQVLHEKHTFIERTRQIGLTVPDTHTITNRDQALSILLDAKLKHKYIMKPIGMDDANRGDMTLLPKGSPEDTSLHVSKLRISSKSPWILQQYISGPEYCTHSLVIDGEVKVFIACPSAELLMHYEGLPAGSNLSKAMLQFTKRFASHHGKGFTGHLSFDFMVEATDDCDPPTLYPIECNPRAHTAVVLFSDTPNMVDAYLEAIPNVTPRRPSKDGIVTPARADKYFWIGHDLGEFGIAPLMQFSLSNPGASVLRIVKRLQTLIIHIIYWKDGTFEGWDPLPWWMLYHVYWPLQFARAMMNGKRWSRINVSTTKMFEC